MELVPGTRVRLKRSAVPRADAIDRAMSSAQAASVALRLLTRTQLVQVTCVGEQWTLANFVGRPLVRDFVLERSEVWGTDEELQRAVALLARAAEQYAPEQINTQTLRRVLAWQERMDAAGAEFVSYPTRGRIVLDLQLADADDVRTLPDSDEELAALLAM